MRVKIDYRVGCGCLPLLPTSFKHYSDRVMAAARARWPPHRITRDRFSVYRTAHGARFARRVLELETEER